MSEVSPAQRTAPARATFASKFSSPEAKSEYYRALSARSHAGRLQLSGEDAAALRAACSILARLAQKYQLDVHPVVVVAEVAHGQK